ncbi:MAG: acyl-phosphate glycerol 3-phosphate acyltransferase [Nitrospinae bacterium CG11_big_fil_rev_8_21_14_0_20_56_8]|nr:MAG: acyl-phosphate glycerol 3-phosphate acyltransferase [Nitrospinae bacterium CG11_big_fil_rev_8_21_14_0_20_56_8]
MKILALTLLAYFLGSIPFGLIFGRAKKIDIRQHGSGNIGATNVARVLGTQAGILTLMGDVGKGLAAVALADQLTGTLLAAALAGLAAFLGHLYSIFLRFQGGKGVATGLGILLYLMPVPALCGVGIFALTLRVSRYVSLSSILSALSTPVFAIYFKTPLPYLYVSVILALLVIHRHQGNIDRLLAGTESSFSRN